MFGFLLNNQSNTPTFSEVIFHTIKKLVNKETMFCRALHPKTMLLCENLFKVALLLKKKKKFFQMVQEGIESRSYCPLHT